MLSLHAPEAVAAPMYADRLPPRAFAPQPGFGHSAHAVAVAGALCQLFTQASEVQLASLLHSIEAGDAPAAARTAQGILGAIAFTARGEPAPETTSIALSSRELKVLCMIARGATNRQIAEETHRSINTIEAQVKSVYRKLGVNSRTQAVREAMQRGLLTWQPGRDDGVSIAADGASVSPAC
ncbi:response regulator transcription factor [Variovorax sp. W6]|uniref:response regulator transcription factor n=1 Tax=Variovorax sp. W6 TaxID=3093895 RepID=UPI003D8057EA